MRRPDVHGAVYQLLVTAVAIIALAFLSTRLTDQAKLLTPDQLRLMVTWTTIVLSVVVLLELAISHYERLSQANKMESRLASIEGSVAALSGDVEDLIDMTTKTGPIKGFLVSAKMMLKEEAALVAGEVWVYTPELTADLTEPFSKVIAANISGGIVYRYLLPDVPDRRGDFEILVSNVCKASGKGEDEVREQLKVCWLPPTLSRPGGMTVHVGNGQDRHVAAYTTIPYETWANDFFIRMDNTYASRALHYLRQLEADHRTV